MPVCLSFRARLAWVTFCLCSSVSLFAATPDVNRVEQGTRIIEHWLKTKAVSSELAYLEMQTLDPSGLVEERKFLAVFRRDESGGFDYLVRLTAPVEVKGVSLLAHKSSDGSVEQSIYLPAVGRTRPLSGDAKATPFLGSDFSYADLLEEIPAEQVYERLPDRFIHGSESYVVKATPREAAASPYGYREIYLDKITFDLLRIDFFDNGGEFIKYLAAYDYNSPRIAGRSTRPLRAVMTDIRRDTSTIMTVIQSRVEKGIGPEIFTTDSIENWTDEAIDEFIFEMFLEVSGDELDLE